MLMRSYHRLQHPLRLHINENIEHKNFYLTAQKCALPDCPIYLFSWLVDHY